MVVPLGALLSIVIIIVVPLGETVRCRVLAIRCGGSMLQPCVVRSHAARPNRRDACNVANLWKPRLLAVAQPQNTFHGCKYCGRYHTRFDCFWKLVVVGENMVRIHRRHAGRFLALAVRRLGCTHVCLECEHGLFACPKLSVCSVSGHWNKKEKRKQNKNYQRAK
jgi:hypothetical protein